MRRVYNKKNALTEALSHTRNILTDREYGVNPANISFVPVCTLLRFENAFDVRIYSFICFWNAKSIDSCLLIAETCVCMCANVDVSLTD